MTDRVTDRVIDVVIADDNPTMRAALRASLALADDIRVVGEAPDGMEALRLARLHRPHVTLLDYRMPVADGLAVVGPLARYCAVLVLTSDRRDALVSAMLRGGANGFLVHGEFGPEEAIRAVRAVAAGKGWLSAQSARTVADALRGSPTGAATPGGPEGLTARESEVLDLLCLGLSNAAIGERLNVTEKTVKNHLNHAFAKLDVTSRSEAIVRWLRGA